MSVSREILTLQFGHYANFVGTHWWNMHEEQFMNLPYEENENELDYDVLYREGQTNRGQTTFTPRVLLADLKGSLKDVPEISDLYEPLPNTEEIEPNWDEQAVELAETDPQKPNTPQNKFMRDPNYKFSNISSQNVNFWSEFLYRRFHPRTVNIIKEHSHTNQHLFSGFEAGKELFKTEFFEDDFCDKIRLYSEECDLMQGFHVLTDTFNGFSGLAASCVEYISDEYNKKSTMVFPVFFNNNNNTDSLEKISNNVLNTVLLYDSLTQNAGLTVPLSTNTGKSLQENRNFKFVNYQFDSMYHTSALIASALDLFTLNYRIKNSQIKLQDMIGDLSNYNKKIAVGSLLMPLNYHNAQIFSDFLEFDKEPLVCLSPNCEIDYNTSLQYFGLRGFSPSVFKNDPYLNKGNSFMYKNRLGQSSFNNVCNVQRCLPVSGTYPKIIDKYAQEKDSVLPSVTGDLPAVKAIAGLHSTSKIGEMIMNLLEEEKRLRIGYKEIAKHGIELDNYKESIERLKELESHYSLKQFFDE